MGVCARGELVQALADKVVKGIAKLEGSSDFNGVHLRMERDAIDWANILGGKEHYWETYLEAMEKAKFSKDTPLYVASGLLTGSTDINSKSQSSGDPESIREMQTLAKDIIDHGVRTAMLLTRHAVNMHAQQVLLRIVWLQAIRTTLGLAPRRTDQLLWHVQLAKKIVHKEMFLSEKELSDLSKEQSGLVDFLVLRRSKYMVGISVSTFSFYLQEVRLLDGHAQEDTVMYDAYIIGTEEMFHTSAVVATATREAFSHLGMLQNTCKRRNGKPC
jgi:GDP-fucose protein O-fucosyltransferase